MSDAKTPANPFEWRRYIAEEDIRRGVAVATGPKKRIRTPITRTDDTRLKPKGFIVYNKVRKGEGK
jgi:hypothetical protein